jgi:PAS domain S-box-containing protein
MCKAQSLKLPFQSKSYEKWDKAMSDKITILVVEDERIVAKDMQVSLKLLGYQVPAIASSGKEAFDKAAQICPDVILMDINLKGNLDGVETANHIKNHFDVLIIYLTAYADDTTLERAKATEPIGYILKPFKIRELHATIQMAIVKHRMEIKLKKQAQWFATVLKSIGDAVIATDIEGLVTYMNPVAEQLTGWPQAQAVGRSLIEVAPIINSETKLKIQNYFNQVLQEGVVSCITEQILLVSKSGKEVAVAECTAPILDDQGKVTGLVIDFRDITNLKQAEIEIRNALLKEKELNESKSQFICTTSHEFRTPLATILSSADLLEQYGHRWIEPKKLEHLHRIQNATEHMTKLLDDVLLVNKTELGRWEFEPNSLDLVNFCQDLVQNMQLIAGDSYNIKFMNQGVQNIVYLDEKLLRHILTNLLSNAIKYSPQGDTIEFSLVCNQIAAIFTIKDKGIGIPEKDREQLFQSFYRGSNVGATSGTGLGLTIVKEAVDIHGGEIAFTSVGVGTTFTVTLPLY